MSSKEQGHKNDKDTANRRLPRPDIHNVAVLTPPQTDLAAIIQRVELNPGMLTPHDMLRLQHTVGNQAVTHLIQTKLTVSPLSLNHCIQRVMTVAALKKGAGTPNPLPRMDKPYKDLIKKLEQYFKRRQGTSARGEQSEWLLILREHAHEALHASDDTRRQHGLQKFIRSIDIELGQMKQGMTGQNWRGDLLNPTQEDAWQITPETWREKTSLGQQFSSDAALWYSTLFGAPNAPQINPMEQLREQAQQDILKRMFLTMATAGLESRAGTTSKGETMPALPGAQGRPEDWGEFSFPLAAAMSHGRRAQMQFGLGTQAHKHEGWEWLVTGHGGTTQAEHAGKTFSFGSRVLNSLAGMYSRTSTHSAGAEGEKKYSGLGSLAKGGLSGDIKSQTAGMDVPFGGRGNPLLTDMTIAGGDQPAQPVVGPRGRFPIRPGARDIKGKEIKPDEHGQHGHLLMRPKNIKTEGGKMSNVMVSMEDTAAGAYGLSGHPHTASAAPETTTVTGQTQWTHMEGVGLTRGLSPEELARVPRGYDALRARVQSQEQFQNIQTVSDKIMRELSPDLQKLLFRHLLISDATRARQIMGALIGLATTPNTDFVTAAGAYLNALPALQPQGPAPQPPQLPPHPQGPAPQPPQPQRPAPQPHQQPNIANPQFLQILNQVVGQGALNPQNQPPRGLVRPPQVKPEES